MFLSLFINSISLNPIYDKGSLSISFVDDIEEFTLNFIWMTDQYLRLYHVKSLISMDDKSSGVELRKKRIFE